MAQDLSAIAARQSLEEGEQTIKLLRIPLVKAIAMVNEMKSSTWIAEFLSASELLHTKR